MSGRVLENKVTGEVLRVLESTPGTFKVEYSLRPHGSIAEEHLHPGKEQVVSVLSGEMHLRIEGEHRVVRAGESTTVPPGRRHFQWNPGDVEVVAIEEIRPAGRIEEFFSVLFRLANEGRTDGRGRPSLLLGTAFFAEFRDCVRPGSFGRRLALDALTPLASAFGQRRQLRRYLAPAIGPSGP